MDVAHFPAKPLLPDTAGVAIDRLVSLAVHVVRCRAACTTLTAALSAPGLRHSAEALCHLAEHGSSDTHTLDELSELLVQAELYLARCSDRTMSVCEQTQTLAGIKQLLPELQRFSSVQTRNLLRVRVEQTGVAVQKERDRVSKDVDKAFLAARIAQDAWGLGRRGVRSASLNSRVFKRVQEDIVPRLERQIDSTPRLAIVGMEGIGKTTVAQALFDRISKRYDHALFLRVGHTDDLRDLLCDARHQLFPSDSCPVTEAHSPDISNRLYGKKVLVVLDGLWSKEQLSAWTVLCGRSLPAAGSTVIVTTRHAAVVAGSDWDVEEPRLLEKDSARRLLCHHAFSAEQQPSAYGEVVEAALAACGGLPLALKVVGAALKDRSVHVWRQLLKQLTQDAGNGGGSSTALQEAARVCMSALPPFTRRCATLFAAFPQGHAVTQSSLRLLFAAAAPFPTATASAWVDHQFELLERRCLVETIPRGSERSYVMHEAFWRLAEFDASSQSSPAHDLFCFSDLRAAGVVDNQPAWRGAGWRWVARQLLHSLCCGGCSRGAGALQGADAGVVVHADAVHADTSSQVVSLCGSPAKALRLHAPLTRQLLVRDLPRLDALTGLQACRHLRVLQLRGVALRALPLQPAWVPCLRALDLQHCRHLVQLPASLSGLVQLQHLDLGGCESLADMPASLGSLTDLQFLRLSGCTALRQLPASLGGLRQLQQLLLDGCVELRALPASLGQLQRLAVLNMGGCVKLRCLPDAVATCKALREVNLTLCGALTALPTGLRQLAQLRKLGVPQELPVAAVPNSVRVAAFVTTDPADFS